MTRRILILDSAGSSLSALVQSFKSAVSEGSIELLPNFEELLRRLRDPRGCDLVVIDYEVGDGATQGLRLVPGIRAVDEDVPVVLVAKQGDVKTAAAAIHAGATDFLVQGEELAARVATLIGKVGKYSRLVRHNRALLTQQQQILAAEEERYQIIGESAQMRDLLQCIIRLAKIPRPILILGERGTGKELVARAVHKASGARGPFVVVNCAAFSDPLLESELFGHEKGAFTGAERSTQGKFEVASGGTLFLDEIGNMSLAFQQKVLRVVEYSTFTRVGGNEELRTDARIIAATNADLLGMIDEGEFLRDLYDRLSFEVISIPPLRERPQDIERLAQHFLDMFMREIPQLSGKRLSKESLASLRRYPFPGNVRELKNLVERAAYRDVTNEITPEDLGLTESEIPTDGTFENRLDAFKSRLIRDALKDTSGNQAQAARRLGLSYHQFRYLYKKYNESW